MNKNSETLSQRFKAKAYLRSAKDFLKYPTNSTVLVHIGKCGGRTLTQGLNNAVRNTDVKIVHIRKPIYRKDLKYIIVARNPVARLRSAFRWRYKLVVTDGAQRNRFKGEHDILVKYGTLNNLAEALYHEDGSANALAQRDIRNIHHIYEDIFFYIGDLLKKCQPNQIVDVLMQENLDDDIYRVFGYRNELHENKNPANQDANELSEVAISNLMRFFAKDYEALIKLYSWGKIKKEVFVRVI